MRKKIGWGLIALAVAACLASLIGAPGGVRASYIASCRSGAFATPEPPEGMIRVNEADAEELTELPGIGETLAWAIIEEREKNGPFHFAEDLMAVRGIGQSKLAEIFPYISLD